MHHRSNISVVIFVTNVYFIISFLSSEQITIPSEKQFVVLEGDGKWKTIVSWNRVDKLDEEATFMSLADDLIVRNMGFVVS